MFANGTVNPYAMITHSSKLSISHSALVSSLGFNRRFIGASSLNRRVCGIGPFSHEERVNFASKSRRDVSVSFGDNDITADSIIYPRINMKDPYERLGISHEASSEEIQAARNFLTKKYSNHKPSVNAIESAHDMIMMQSLFERKNPKVDLTKKFKEASESKFLKFIASRFEAPSKKVIWKNAVAFILLGLLTARFPTEEGPTLQVLTSLGLTVYFIYERLQSRLWALLFGVGSFFGSWTIGTFLMVAVIPPLFKAKRSLEVSTAIVSYIFLWISSTYLK